MSTRLLTETYLLNLLLRDAAHGKPGLSIAQLRARIEDQLAGRWSPPATLAYQIAGRLERTGAITVVETAPRTYQITQEGAERCKTLSTALRPELRQTIAVFRRALKAIS